MLEERDGEHVATPSFLVIGAMKSGTTTLHRTLEQHPEIYGSAKKEIHFFDRHYDNGMQWYEEWFTPGPGHVASGESCPEYMFAPWARERIVADLPDTRFLVVLREPVSRAYSQYMMNRLKGLEPIETFEKAVDLEERRISRGARRRQLLFSYVRRSRYIEDLLWWEERVGRERLHVFLMDDMTREPVPTMARVFDFLGVDPAVSEAIELGHWKRGKSPDIRSLPDSDAVVPYDRINPGTEARLRSGFRESNLALQDWLGRPLTSWIDR